jgi:hypothetical protein
MTSRPERRKSPGRRRGSDDPVEAVEHIVPRRQLIVDDGDFVVLRKAAGLSPTQSGSIYELLVYGFVTGGERFTTFELAVARGSELAAKWRTRLFYADAPDSAPHLLEDCRPAVKNREGA